MTRVEAMPAIQAATERSERISPAQRVAKQEVYGPLDDEAAKVALGERIGAKPKSSRRPRSTWQGIATTTSTIVRGRSASRRNTHRQRRAAMAALVRTALNPFRSGPLL